MLLFHLVMSAGGYLLYKATSYSDDSHPVLVTDIIQDMGPSHILAASLSTFVGLNVFMALPASVDLLSVMTSEFLGIHITGMSIVRFGKEACVFQERSKGGALVMGLCSQTCA